MEFKMNLHNNTELFSAAITKTAEELQIKKHFVEKDYWICHCLQQMVNADIVPRAKHEKAQ